MNHADFSQEKLILASYSKLAATDPQPPKAPVLEGGVVCVWNMLYPFQPNMYVHACSCLWYGIVGDYILVVGMRWRSEEVGVGGVDGGGVIPHYTILAPKILCHKSPYCYK